MTSSVTVITTVQSPTPSVRELSRRLQQFGHSLIAVGDRKSRIEGWESFPQFVDIDSQRRLSFELARELPENHYSRKNIGYLLAVQAGADSIFDTDDDNAPEENWRPRGRRCEALSISQPGWVNVYAHFSKRDLWPRGLPIQYAHNSSEALKLGTSPSFAESPIQQTLVNGSPDVDAIWRLLGDREIRFDAAPSLCLEAGTWSPFNSQSTWWFRPAFELMYLPSHVSFRMTDIWRSFVAQRCLWELGFRVVFHAADMFQDRNPHNLLRDFEQEVPGYLRNEEIRLLLEELHLSSSAADVGENLYRCYEALVARKVVPPEELPLVRLWLRALSELAGSSSGTKTGATS